MTTFRIIKWSIVVVSIVTLFVVAALLGWNQTTTPSPTGPCVLNVTC